MEIEPTVPQPIAAQQSDALITVPQRHSLKEWPKRSLYSAPSTATRFSCQMLLPLLPYTVPPKDGVAPAAVPLASATVFKPQHISASRTPGEGTVDLTVATNVEK